MSVLATVRRQANAETISWVVAEGDYARNRRGRHEARARPTDENRSRSRRFALAGIVEYEAAELVLTARPGEPLASINAELAKKRQMLAFEPPDWRALLGAEGEQTLGGVIACNLAGSRRVRAGSARDYVLGFSAVNGFGEIWKAGGKVVKNVTGYDMCKLQAGAYGTLSALTELTIKVMPKPETACTIVLHGLADDVAIPVVGECAELALRGLRRRAFAGLRSAPFEGERGGGGARRRDGYAAGRPAAVGRLSDRGPRSVWSGGARVSTMRRRRPSGPRSAPFSRFSRKDRASFGGSVRRQAMRRPSRIRFCPRCNRRNFTSIGAAA